ncbi:MAG: NAD(P)/FAD-dependent oxidoreductase [Armatimonadota bacterium]
MRVGVIGGGPAGAVCAIELRRGTVHGGERPEVLLFDGKSFAQAGPQGCNMCAGVIPKAVLDRLAAMGAVIQEALVQREITGHYFETRAGGVHIPKDPDATIYTVFRSAGPRTAVPETAQSFDYLLLQTALQAGVVHVDEHVKELRMPEAPDKPFRLQTAREAYEVDVVVGAFGVNSPLVRRFAELGFGYQPPGTYRVAQAEMPVGADFITSVFGGEIKIFALGLPGIAFGALTPKRTHVTVTVIGRDVDRADLERFLEHPRVRLHLPPDWTLPPVYCHCAPRIPVTAGKNVVTDRLLVIGEAHIARYLKGGIESAFFTGTRAAEAILAGDLSQQSLYQRYVRPCHARYLRDNEYGQFLFRLNDVISGSQLLSRAGRWLLEREQRRPHWRDRHHTHIMWYTFTGSAPYREIVREAFHPSAVLRTLLAVALSATGILKDKTNG